MSWLSWKRFGEILEWLGVFYFVGFVLFGLITVAILLPRLREAFTSAGQGAIFGVEQQIIGPLLIFFVLISAGAWYQGREIIKTADLNWYDKLVGIFLALALVLLGTPQLYQAITSLIPALR